MSVASISWRLPDGTKRLYRDDLINVIHYYFKGFGVAYASATRLNYK